MRLKNETRMVWENGGSLWSSGGLDDQTSPVSDRWTCEIPCQVSNEHGRLPLQHLRFGRMVWVDCWRSTSLLPSHLLFVSQGHFSQLEPILDRVLPVCRNKAKQWEVSRILFHRLLKQYFRECQTTANVCIYLTFWCSTGTGANTLWLFTLQFKCNRHLTPV